MKVTVSKIVGGNVLVMHLLVGLSFKKGIDYSTECWIGKIMQIPVEDNLDLYVVTTGVVFD